MKKRICVGSRMYRDPARVQGLVGIRVIAVLGILATIPVDAFTQSSGDLRHGSEGHGLPENAPPAFTAQLVADLAGPEQSGPAHVTEFDVGGLREYAWLGGRLFFAADDGTHGRELWMSDGTSEGAEMVVDLCPGLCSGNPFYLRAGANAVAFAANDGESGLELWRSDGSSEGTFQLADQGPGPQGSFSDVVAFGEGWLGTRKTSLGRDLVQFPDVPAGMDAGQILAGGLRVGILGFVANEKLFFSAQCPGEEGIDCLWRTDGSPTGTTAWPPDDPLRTSSQNYGTSRWAVLGDLLFLDGGPWNSVAVQIDGSHPDTVELHPNEFTYHRTSLGGRVFYRLLGAEDAELWSSDGTLAGTHRHVLPALEGESLLWLNRTGDTLVVGTRSAEDGYRVWAADATLEEVVLLLDPQEGPAAPGTGLLEHLSGASDPGSSTVLLMRLTDESDVGQTWSTDGTPQGTHKLTGLDTEVGPPSYGSGGFFRVHSGTSGPMVYPVMPSEGDYFLPDWWVTDGTLAGTKLLMSPSRGSSWPQVLHRGPKNELLFLTRADREADLWRYQPGQAPVRLNGPATPPMAVHFPRSSVAVTSEAAYYEAEHYSASNKVLRLSESGSLETFIEAEQDAWLSGLFASSQGDLLSPWNEDDADEWAQLGPEPGVVTTLGVAPLGAHGVHEVALQHDTTYLSSSNGLWRFGEGGNAELVSPLPENTFHFTPGKEELFFVEETWTFSQWDRELWVTDGTENGTVQLLSNDEDPDVIVWEGWEDRSIVFTKKWYHQYEPPPAIVNLGDQAFFAAKTDAQGIELWTTARGKKPQLVKDLAEGSESGFPRFFFSIGKHIFFVANDGEHGEELWTSDGTPGGTYMVSDLNPGSVGSRPREFVQCGDNLCYSAYRPDVGRELWTLPVLGAVAESLPRLAADIAPGSGSSSPSQLFVHNGALYFSANDGTTGFELWRVDLGGGGDIGIFSDGFETGNTNAWSEP